MGAYVKNTIFDDIMSAIAPHHCCGCGIVGTILCESCKYDISNEPYAGCITCGRIANNGHCGRCQTAYERGWCVGTREDTLQSLIDDFKFNRKQQAHQALAQLLNDTVPMLPSDVVVTSVPTVARHIRVRGYDHSMLLAREFARLRGLRYRPTLLRATNTQQRGASRNVRLQQAAQAFVARDTIESRTYLLVDDIVTTGASLHHAAKALKNNGAHSVWVAVLAHQPLAS